MKLLTRDQFREGVFARDNHKCVFCDKPAVDAHHILERRLFSDGGYYLNNGASVCEDHHLQCEMTLISVEDVREACGIEKKVIPPDFYDDHIYDKWGNTVLTNGTRTRGELFFDESVQKILDRGGVLNLFTPYVKYPRTFHTPWSQGMNSDDKMLKDMEHFHGKDVVVTVKMDGENTSVYQNYIHARSIDGRHHPSRDWVKNFASSWQYELPDLWRVCGENLFAQHSIAYDDLASYFMGFSIWDDVNNCLSWDDTITWFDMLGIESVPVLYRGIYDEKVIKELWDDSQWNTCEGNIIRLADSYHYRDFKKSVAKFVRKDHVQTIKHHWQFQKVVPNKLRD